MYTVIKPISEALSNIISNEELIKNLGLKVISDIPLFKNYLQETDRAEVLKELLSKDEGAFIVIDDFVVNDHFVIGVKSSIIDEVDNTIIFFLPSNLEFESQAKENLNQILDILTLDSNKKDFMQEYEKCLIQCKMMKIIRKSGFEEKNSN